MASTSQPSPSKRFPEDADPEDPLVGARLRYALTLVEQRILEALASAGFADIQIAHFKVFRFPPPDNVRPIDLAQRAGTTKQAMNYLLLQLEQSGYLKRSAAEGPNGRLVSLTEKGWEVARIQREAVRDVERRWQQKIGKRRFQSFYAMLRELTD